VVTQVVEDPKVPWREDELDAILDRLRFSLSNNLLTCGSRLPHILGPAKDIIPASGERILTQGLLIHAE
jgi:hypothetical protein